MRQCIAEADRVRAAWAAPDVLSKQIKWGPWGTMPGLVAGGIGVREMVIHAWDVAKATGQDTSLPNELAERLLAGMQATDAGMRGPRGFRAKVDLPADASATDRLVAFAGRQP